ncbi:MAG: hypothetical protein HKN54_06560 [Flavobacteriaceae bacterium]|nr:hypothetical protein [Flavobacteriaceae bacterium]
MKSMKCRLLLMLAAVLFVGNIYAQDEKKSQMYVVHEDQVKPSMLAEYEKTSKALADAMKKHNIQSTSWLSSVTDDFRYMWVTPIESMADLDDNSWWTELSEAMGNDALTELMSGFGPCYDKHGDYVISMNKELTYMPDGITQTPEGENYRKFYYIHHLPKDRAAMSKAMKGVKDLFASKNSEMNYRVYSNGFGTMDTFYMVAVSAKDPIDMEQRSAANDKLLGEAAGPVFGKVMALATKFEEFTGNVRPELSYKPKKDSRMAVDD